MSAHCQNCGSINTNGTKFCTRRCRLNWKNSHEIKGAKKRAKQQEEEILMSFGSGFSNE